MTTPNPSPTGHTSKWESNYLRLVEFKRRNGHCRVPNRYEDGKLGRWVAVQRKEYKDFFTDGSGTLTPERLWKLGKIGFEREVENPHEEWLTRCGELCEFQNENGHCLVPAKYPPNKQLGIWVQTQRTKRKQSSLPRDRYLILEKIGFEWRAKPGKKKTAPKPASAVSKEEPTVIRMGEAQPDPHVFGAAESVSAALAQSNKTSGFSHQGPAGGHPILGSVSAQGFATSGAFYPQMHGADWVAQTGAGGASVSESDAKVAHHPSSGKKLVEEAEYMEESDPAAIHTNETFNSQPLDSAVEGLLSLYTSKKEPTRETEKTLIDTGQPSAANGQKKSRMVTAEMEKTLLDAGKPAAVKGRKRRTATGKIEKKLIDTGQPSAANGRKKSRTVTGEMEKTLIDTGKPSAVKGRKKRTVTGEIEKTLINSGQPSAVKGRKKRRTVSGEMEKTLIDTGKPSAGRKKSQTVTGEMEKTLINTGQPSAVKGRENIRTVTP